VVCVGSLRRRIRAASAISAGGLRWCRDATTPLGRIEKTIGIRASRSSGGMGEKRLEKAGASIPAGPSTRTRRGLRFGANAARGLAPLSARNTPPGRTSAVDREVRDLGIVGRHRCDA